MGVLGVGRFNRARDRETPASPLFPMVATTAQAQYKYTTITAATRPRTMERTRRESRVFSASQSFRLASIRWRFSRIWCSRSSIFFSAFLLITEVAVDPGITVGAAYLIVEGHFSLFPRLTHSAVFCKLGGTLDSSYSCLGCSSLLPPWTSPVGQGRVA